MSGGKKKTTDTSWMRMDSKLEGMMMRFKCNTKDTSEGLWLRMRRKSGDSEEEGNSWRTEDLNWKRQSY